MSLLCIEYKVVTVAYFLDEIKPYELAILLTNLNVAVKNDWTIARQIMYSNLVPWSKSKLTPSEIMHLPWDDDNNNAAPKQAITPEMVEQMRRQSDDRRAQLIAAGVL